MTEDQLAKVLTSKTMGGGVIEFFSSPLDKKKAGLSRNSLVMHIYCLVFDWCVDLVNDAIAVKECDYAIGVLDIFGFENFVLNSFPQLCINFTNESLHNLFIEHVFKLEQETYIREEVQWNFVEYEDNQPTIDLISKRPVCILGLLDEGCATGSATDATVILNFHGAFKDPKKHKAYKTPKKSPDKCFCIIHYAGEVRRRPAATGGWREDALHRPATLPPYRPTALPPYRPTAPSSLLARHFLHRPTAPSSTPRVLLTAAAAPFPNGRSSTRSTVSSRRTRTSSHRTPSRCSTRRRGSSRSRS